MKFLSVITLLSASALMLLNSCAEEMSENSLEVSKTAWKKWADAYVVSSGKVEPLGADGAYIERVSNAGSDAKAVEAGKWLRLNFTGWALQQPETIAGDGTVNLADILGNVYATRYKEVAELQGTSTNYTDYVPQYIQLSDNIAYSGVPVGQYLALMKMKQGDSMVVYMPSFLAYGASSPSYSKGYQGQFNLAAGANIAIGMKVVEVIDDIVKYQDEKVDLFARDARGWNLSYADTLKTNLFVQRFDPLDKEDLGFDPEIPFDPTVVRDSITVDSTVKIYYIGKFLNGFIFDTNIDTVAQRVWNDFSTKKPLSYTPNSGGLISAFYDAVNSMVYNECAKMVFTPNYGYGSAGDSAGNTIIQPYSPLIFEFFVPTNIKKVPAATE